MDGLDIALCRSKVVLVQVSRSEIYHTPTYEVALCLSPRPGPFGLKPGGMDSFSFSHRCPPNSNDAGFGRLVEGDPGASHWVRVALLYMPGYIIATPSWVSSDSLAVLGCSPRRSAGSPGGKSS